jgi:predicted secreted hydrolase
VRRRAFLRAIPAALALPHAAWGAYPEVRSGVPLQFPQDHGAHPEYRTEWWYLTGWMQDQDRRPLGIQITFFRNRPLLQEDNPSAFAPKQLLFAHAAVAEPEVGQLLHDQRAARAGFGLAHVSTATTDVRVDDWSLALDAAGYHARIAAREFEMEAQFTPTQPILLQGANGYSRKGPQPTQASYYYSRPHLATRLTLRTTSGRRTIGGAAWLDHEWSSQILDPGAAGWDWAGINLDDGAALTVFRIRRPQGSSIWGGGSLRPSQGSVQAFAPADVAFTPMRHWRSPRTAVEYPVAMRVRVAGRAFDLTPLMDDQELDARASTGTIYWEGAVRAAEAGRETGRGYLELTGYWRPLEL